MVHDPPEDAIQHSPAVIVHRKVIGIEAMFLQSVEHARRVLKVPCVHLDGSPASTIVFLVRYHEPAITLTPRYSFRPLVPVT